MVNSLLQGSGLIKPVQSTSAPGTSGLSLEMYNAQKQQWQEQLSQKRDAIIRKGKADGLDTNQVNKHLDQLYTNARVKALDIKLRFAKLNKPADPMAEFGKLDVYRNRIETRLDDFQVRPGRMGRSIRHPFRGQRDTELEIFEPTTVGKDKKGEFRGTWRKATLDEVKEYGVLTREQKRVTAAQQPMMGGLMNTAVNSRRMGGAIQDQAKAYIQEKTEAEPEQEDDPSGRYNLGQVINHGGKSYKIVGFFPDGEPDVVEVR